MAIAAAKTMRKDFPDLLTIVAPRHPARGEEIKDLALTQEEQVSLRSANEPIRDETTIYIADTLGELGVFYRISDIAFVGGSVNPKGGHNPLEPARLGCAIMHGSHTFNFTETYRDLRLSGAAGIVRHDRDLAYSICRLLSDDKTRSTMAQAAMTTAKESAQRNLDNICDALFAEMTKTMTAPR